MRYFIELMYNGKSYHGWQIQPNAVSIQEMLNKTISTLLRQNINVIGAGRTDTGVHAEQLFAHFDSNVEVDQMEMINRMNAFLPDDIVVKNIFRVADDAHARFDAIARSYEYRIWLGRNPFLLDTTWQIYQGDLDIEKMNKAAEVLMEYTNFKCFSKSKTDVKTYICDVKHAKWVLEGNLLTFYISADRFLRNMVRSVVGTLIDVGMHKINLTDFRKIIESEDRRNAGFSVPAQGLFLTKVEYPIEIVKNYT